MRAKNVTDVANSTNTTMVQRSSKILKELMRWFSLIVIWITNIGLARVMTSARIA